jgi:uncharacterized protein YecE (DUF72 family)
MNKSFFAGTSGLVLPVPNKAGYPQEYQEKSRLCFYSSIFNSIEVNSSFYKIPMASTITRWASDVPNTFKFTFKLFQEITHAKDLQYDSEHIYRFMETINHVGNKKGCLLVQFPPKFAFQSIMKLGELLTDLRLANAGLWNIAVEFRNISWYNETVYDLLKENNIGMVIQDLPSSATPISNQSANFIYLRFHGPQGGYRGSYPDDFLSEYSDYIKEWMDEGKTVYVYFNNTMGNAFNNLVTLKDYVQSL